jgi:multimeric flavodoxin WrbA
LKITLVDGNDPSGNTSLDEYLNRLADLLADDHDVAHVRLHELKIKDCMGCFGCWQKTPGKCLHTDDMVPLYSRYIKSDLVLLAAPIIMGFPAARLKRFHDRLIPVIHPYVAIVHEELHHATRYSKYPNIGLLLAKEPDTDDEDIDIIIDMYRRIGISFSSPFVYSAVIDNQPPEAIAHEISRH